MPTYEYKCDACGKHFDQFQSMTAPLLKKCPACHKSSLRRLIGAGAGLIFKGSGFYITDYRSDSYKSAAKSDSSTTSTTTSTGTNNSSSDSKTPATQPASKPAAKKAAAK